jgi:acetoacetyl-CoA synthetase
MVWNFLVSGLALGTTVVCFDGSPTKPDALRALADCCRRTSYVLRGFRDVLRKL